jgi:hypothetical protein
MLNLAASAILLLSQNLSILLGLIFKPKIP